MLKLNGFSLFRRFFAFSLSRSFFWPPKLLFNEPKWYDAETNTQTHTHTRAVGFIWMMVWTIGLIHNYRNRLTELYEWFVAFVFDLKSDQREGKKIDPRIIFGEKVLPSFNLNQHFISSLIQFVVSFLNENIDDFGRENTQKESEPRPKSMKFLYVHLTLEQ